MLLAVTQTDLSVVGKHLTDEDKVFGANLTTMEHIALCLLVCLFVSYVIECHRQF